MVYLMREAIKRRSSGRSSGRPSGRPLERYSVRPSVAQSRGTQWPLRRNQGAIKAQSRRNQGAIKAQSRRNQGAIEQRTLRPLARKLRQVAFSWRGVPDEGGNQGRSSVRSSGASRTIKGDMNLEQGAVAERSAQVAVGYEMRAPEREAPRLMITSRDDEGAAVLRPASSVKHGSSTSINGHQ